MNPDPNAEVNAEEYIREQEWEATLDALVLLIASFTLALCTFGV